MDFNGTKVEKVGAPVVCEITKEEVKEMIEPFNKEELMEILQDTVTDHLEVLGEIRKRAEAKDPIGKTIFVGGIAQDTTSDTLKTVFSSFGEVLEVSMKLHKENPGKRRRGFAFVTFSHIDGAQRALKQPRTRIDGKTIQCNRVDWRPIAPRRIYISNVPMAMTKDRLSAIFAQFGEIEEGSPNKFDKFTGRWCGHGCSKLIFKSAESATRALQQPIFTIDGNHTYRKLVVREHPAQQAGVTSGLIHGLTEELEQALGRIPLAGGNQSPTSYRDGPYSQFWSQPFTEFNCQFVPAEFVFSKVEPIRVLKGRKDFERHLQDFISIASDGW